MMVDPPLLRLWLRGLAAITIGAAIGAAGQATAGAEDPPDGRAERGAGLERSAGLEDGSAQGEPAERSADAAARPTLEVYLPRHRAAEDLLPAARAAMGTAGVVVADTGRGALVLRGRPTDVAATVEILHALDRPVQQYAIEARTLTREELEARGFRIDAAVIRIPVRDVRRLEWDSPNRTRVRATLGAREARTTSQFSGRVRVAAGETATLFTGQPRSEVEVEIERPLGVRGPVRRRRRATLRPHASRARSGLRVTPVPLPDGRVRLAVEVVRELGSSSDVPLELGATTQVELSPGDVAILADSSMSRVEDTGSLLGTGYDSRRIGGLIALRVDRAEAARPPSGPPRDESAGEQRAPDHLELQNRLDTLEDR